MPSGSLGGQLQGTGSLAGQLPSNSTPSSLPLALTLADTTTSTAPDGITEQHTTTGVPAAGFGITDPTYLESAGGNVRRAVEIIKQLSVATDAAECSTLKIRLMVGGALQDCGFFTFATNAATPRFYLGDPTQAFGLLRVNSTNLQFIVNGSVTLDLTPTTATVNGALTVTGKALSSDSMKQAPNLTNADVTKTSVDGTEFTLPASTLTGAHVLTLGITGAATNQILRVTRLDQTANNYTVKDDAATTLLVFSAGAPKQAADFKFNGTHFVLDRFWNLN